jgi:hypothetical protein
MTNRKSGEVALSQLLDLAIRSARLRLYKKIGYGPSLASDWGDRTHPFCVLNDSILYEMEYLGKQLRNSGSDIRSSYFYPLLEHKDRYEYEFEWGRLVWPAHLTPKLIYECLCLQNTIIWNGWKVVVHEADEVTDDYGQPAWESRIEVINSKKESVDFSGIKKETARIVYTHITGLSTDARVDGIGYDKPHPLEGIPWYAIDERRVEAEMMWPHSDFNPNVDVE